MWKVSITTSQQRASALSTVFEDHALSIAWFEVDEQQDVWKLDILFEDQPSEQWLQSQVGDENYQCEYIQPQDWLSQNQAAFPPIDVGPFYIYGSHIQQPLPADRLTLQIDAATAFGTGEHATTQSCLYLLDVLKQDNHKFNSILDLGCGTGILGMGAALLFDQRLVMMSDNDPEAVRMTQYNIEQNSLINRCQVILSEGFESEVLQNQAPFDLIIANILANPLIMLAPDIQEYSSNDTTVILSGLLNTQVTAVTDAYDRYGFKLIQQHVIGDWSALWFKKAS